MNDNKYSEGDFIIHRGKQAIVHRILGDEQGVILQIQYLGSRALQYIKSDNEYIVNATENEALQHLRVAQDLLGVISEYQRTLCYIDKKYPVVEKLLSMVHDFILTLYKNDVDNETE